MNIPALIQKCAKPHVCPECGGKGGEIIQEKTGVYDKSSGISEIVEHGEPCNKCNGTGKYLSIPSHLMQINRALCKADEAWSGKHADIEWYFMMKKNYYTINRHQVWNDKKAFQNCIENTPEDYLAQAFILILDLCKYLDIEPTEYETFGMLDVPVSSNIYALCSFIFDYDSRNSQTKWITTFIQAFDAFCTHYNILPEQHIEARIEYEKAIKED